MPLDVTCLWGILCRLTSTDQDTNNISLFNVIEEIQLPSTAFQAETKQGVYFPHEIVSLWDRVIDTKIDDSAYHYDCAVSFIDPTGVKLANIVTPFIFTKGKERMRIKIAIDGFPPLTNPGSYIYRIDYKPSTKEEFRKEDFYEIPIQIKIKS